MTVPTNRIGIRIDRIDTNATHLAAMADNGSLFSVEDAITRAQEIIFHAEKLIDDINEWLNEEVN